MKQKAYVYTYSLSGVPIYVGIGTEDGGAFSRAFDLKGHPEIQKDERKKVRVDIVHRNLPRPTALRMEMTLIQVLGSVHKLRNLRTKYKDVSIQTVAAGDSLQDLTVQEQVKYLLKTQHKEIVRECLEFFKSAQVSVFHNLYLAPKVSAHEKALFRAGIQEYGDYNPYVDSFLIQIQEYMAEKGFDPVLEKMVVIVTREKHAKKLRKALSQYKYITGSASFIVCSLEHWVSTVLLNAENNKVARSVMKAGPTIQTMEMR